MWTKSQKVAGAVLGLAVVAFCVDRFVLSPPGGEQPAEAAAQFVVKTSATSGSSSSDKPAAIPPATPANANAAAVTSATNAMTLASRLQAMGETRRLAYEPSGDAFRPSDAWVIASQPKPAASAATAKRAPARAVPKVDHAALFLRRHKLSAVMAKQDRGGMAIVDGKMLALGQTFDGFKLTHVGTADATFTGKGTRVTLKVPGQDVPVASVDLAEAQ